MLVSKNLSKIFKFKEKSGFFKRSENREVCAVDNVNITIEKGKIVGLLGINGAGKTTTIKMLAGLIEPTSGSIFLNDIDIVKEHRNAKQFINIITGGERSIYWRLTAKENLEYFGALYGIKKYDLSTRIDRILEKVGLDGVKNTPVERYSKGMKQRLQIARGLINNPEFIFLDEPTLGLDINIAKQLRDYIKELSKNENKGVLLTTHYIYEAEELCDYIYIIDKGKIISEGTPKELKSSLKLKEKTSISVSTMSEQLIKDLNTFKKENNVDISCSDNNIIINSNIDYIGEIVKILNSNDITIREVKVYNTNLEDVLLEKLSGGSYE